MQTVVTRFDVELRAEVRGRVMSGHASVFGQLASLPSHYEMMAPSAFDSVLSNPETDVRALVNHDPMFLLGRQSSGTLRVSVDSVGLPFEVDLPNTSYANDLREVVERGDLTGASFAFLPDLDEWSQAPDGRQMRTHISVGKLLDVSAVTYPAYDGASVSLRSVTFADPAVGIVQTVASQLVHARHRIKYAPGRVEK